jgi:post-segregation antitoxin (ccd killing protein)
MDAARARVCILRRMPRMQVYLPDDLYQMVKERGLPASELLQEAVRAEVRRRELMAASEKYTTELQKQVGAPTPVQRVRAADVARRIVGRSHRKAG